MDYGTKRAHSCKHHGIELCGGDCNNRRHYCATNAVVWWHRKKGDTVTFESLSFSIPEKDLLPLLVTPRTRRSSGGTSRTRKM